MAGSEVVLEALALLDAHYVGSHVPIDAATAKVWTATGLGGLTDQAVLTTAVEWDTTTHPRFPSSGEFMVAAQAMARLLATEARLEMEAADAATELRARGPVPTSTVAGFVLPVGSELGRVWVESIRAAVAAQRNGGDYTGALNAALAERGMPPVEHEPAPGGERPLAWLPRAGDGTVDCRECGGSRHVESDDPSGAFMVRPCSTCRPIAHRRWVGGHMETFEGHDHCSECRLFRSGHPPAWAQELIVAGFDRT